MSLVNSMPFAFAPIDTGTDSFSAFAFVLVFAFAPMESPQYVYMLFYFFPEFPLPYVGNLSLRLNVEARFCLFAGV